MRCFKMLFQRKARWKMPRYVYARHNPSKTHFDLNEATLPGHRFGYLKRWLRSEPANMAQYKALCSCGWKSDEWSYSRKNAYNMQYVPHIVEARKQGTLFDQDATP